ncbi:MAG: gliding motility-associated protein GldE [Bacteroidetes bacterium]|nr:gliding motility-associated protein GldE [Bacteroidota bacterium]
MDHLEDLVGHISPSSLLLLAANTQGITLLVVVILFLLLVSFFISGAEVAFFSLGHRDINMLKTKQDAGWKRIVTLMQEPKILLGSLIIANSLVNMAIIILSNFLIDELLPIKNNFWIFDFLIKIILVTSFLVLFGDVLPKVWATQNNLRFAYNASYIVEIIHYIFRRVSTSFVRVSDRLERFLGGRASSYNYENLDRDIDSSTDSKTSEEEKNILKGIAKFGNITVRQIMRTRLDVSGVNHSINFHELISRVEELHYSRLPVYKENLDEVIGIINTKDLILYLNEGPDFDWRPLLRQPYFVHEQKLIEDLLTEFKTKRVHFAVVVDEFGGTSGIVTLEDILEEIIGDIKDEFDEEDSGNGKVDDQTYILEGKTMINDACKMMGLPAETFDTVRGESDSLAGLVLELAGEFPKVEDTVVSGDFEFTVLELDRNRIKKVKITIKPHQAKG